MGPPSVQCPTLRRNTTCSSATQIEAPSIPEVDFFALWSQRVKHGRSELNRQSVALPPASMQSSTSRSRHLLFGKNRATGYLQRLFHCRLRHPRQVVQYIGSVLCTQQRCSAEGRPQPSGALSAITLQSDIYSVSPCWLMILPDQSTGSTHHNPYILIHQKLSYLWYRNAEILNRKICR
jgi:hypothetical protein